MRSTLTFNDVGEPIRQTLVDNLTSTHIVL